MMVDSFLTCIVRISIVLLEYFHDNLLEVIQKNDEGLMEIVVDFAQSLQKTFFPQ